MRRIGKASLLFLVLSTAVIGSNFCLSNFHDESDFKTILASDNTKTNTSDKVYISVTNIMFQEDLRVKVKYTIQANSGVVVDENFINETMYGTEFVTMKKGASDIEGPDVIERIPFNPIELVPGGSDSSGTATSESIQLNNGLYDPESSYDGYIVWHEFNDDGSFNETIYQSNARTFTWPVSNFPTYSLKIEAEGAQQSLVSFEVNYDETLTPEIIGDNVTGYFFSTLRFTWENDVETVVFSADSYFNGTTNVYQNVWLDWDQDNHKFTYYILIDDLSNVEHDVVYQFIYNSDHFGSPQTIDNKDFPLKVHAGNKYINLPKIDFTYDTPEDPVNLSDYQKVDLNFVVRENEIWETKYNEVMSSLGYDTNYLELAPINSMSTITVENILSESGEHPDGVADSFNTEQITQYGQVTEPLEITGLDPATTYTADAILNLNSNIFNVDSVTLPIVFSTLDTVNPPQMTYIGDEDLDASDFTNWSRDVLKFNLAPGDWTFNNDLIMPGELFEMGELTFFIDGEEYETITLSRDLLSTLKEGENQINTINLGVDLIADTNYTFELNLEYTSKAKGLFNVGYHPTIAGSFSTRPQIIVPTLRFSGMDLVGDDKTSIDLNYQIIDDAKQLTGDNSDPLSLAQTFETLEIVDFREVTDDGLIEDENIDYTDKLDSSELLLSSEGDNTLRVSGLKGDTTYEFTTVLTFNETANSEKNTGWVPYDEDGQIAITKRVSTDTKFKSFDVEATEISTVKNDGEPTWTSLIEVRAPIGDESVSGIGTPNAGINVSYELQEIGGEGYQISDAISKDDLQTDTVTNEYYYQIEFGNLKPSTTYKFSTKTSYDSSVITTINDSSVIISTGKNDGYSNDMFTSEWGVRDMNVVEENNAYSDIYVSLSLKPEYANNQEFIEGYDSIQLIDPYGKVIYTNYEPLPNTLTPTLWLDGSFLPKSTLDGYSINIVNNENTNDSGESFLLPKLELEGLAEPYVDDNAVINAYPTSVDATLNFKNYNNILSASYAIKNIDSGELVWESNENSNLFNEKDSGDLEVEISTPEGLLEAETNYELSVNINFKDVVESDIGSSIKTFSFKTTPKNTITPEFSITPSYEAVKVNYSWEGNDADTYQLNEISANIYSSQDGYTTPIAEDKIIDVNSVSGNGDFEFLGLQSGLQYRVILEMSYDGLAEVVTQSINTTTLTKNKTFNSSFEMGKETENSIIVEYKYEGLTTKETTNNAAVKSIKFNLYEGETAIGEPLMGSEVNLDSLSYSGSKTFIINDPELIKPNNIYTLEEEVTYTSFSGWDSITNEPNYDVIKKSETTKIEYDKSIVSSTLEFIDDNKLNATITIDDMDEFKFTDTSIEVSLVSNGSPISFVLDGKSRVANQLKLDYLSLYPYASSESTDDKFVYEFELDGIYVPEGDSVELELYYNKQYSGSVAQQTNSPKVDPNSLKALSRYEYSNNYYVYELYVDSDESVDLNSDLSFTKKSSMELQSSEVATIDKTLLSGVGITYNEDNLYLKVDKSITRNDWRDLSFMKYRYMVVDNHSKSIVNFETQSAYYINGFDMIPLPKQPLTFGQVLLIIIFSILLFIFIWFVIYKILKYYDRNKWYDYAQKKAKAYYFMHSKNMTMYAWSHKFNEYESLSNMSVDQLKKYAKKINIPIPYKATKKELVNTLSLLTMTEIARIEEYTNYKIEISEKIREDLLNEFKNDKKESKWMKKRFEYTIDKIQRMQEEDYKKTSKDIFVSVYASFDKAFISFTDWVLNLINLKKKPKKNVEVKDHEWDTHEGESTEKEFNKKTKGGDLND